MRPVKAKGPFVYGFCLYRACYVSEKKIIKLYKAQVCNPIAKLK